MVKSRLLTYSNGLSLLRGPLAFLLIIDSPLCRLTAILLAMFTDSIDGFVARKTGTVSKFGTLLDPLMDKFFVGVATAIFMIEGILQPWQAFALLSRDAAIFIYGVAGFFRGCPQFRFRALWVGKATTALQFLAFLALTLKYPLSPVVFISFFALGGLALIELFIRENRV